MDRGAAIVGQDRLQSLHLEGIIAGQIARILTFYPTFSKFRVGLLEHFDLLFGEFAALGHFENRSTRLGALCQTDSPC